MKEKIKKNLNIQTQAGRQHQQSVDVAQGFLARAIGWLGKSTVGELDAIWIQPCRSVHTFGMRFSIDIVFVSAAGRILSIDAIVGPWKMRRNADANAVLELPAGRTAALGLKVGDEVGLL